MSIVSLESADEKNVSASILNFFTAYGVTKQPAPLIWASG